MKLLTVLSAILLFVSCTNSPEKESTSKTENLTEKSTTPDNKNEPTEDGSQSPQTIYFDYSNSFFSSDYSESISHIFSNDSVSDKFNISIPKGKILDTKSSLLISSAIGDTIHFETFETSELIYDYALDRIKTDEEVIKHIKERVSDNLDETSFIDISTTDLSLITDSNPEDFEDHEAFIYCKTNNLPIYQFLLGNENSTFYGYSKTEKKAVPIIYCC